MAGAWVVYCWLYHMTGIGIVRWLLIDVEQENTPSMASPTFLSTCCVQSLVIFTQIRRLRVDFSDKCLMEIHICRVPKLKKAKFSPFHQLASFCFWYLASAAPQTTRC